MAGSQTVFVCLAVMVIVIGISNIFVGPSYAGDVSGKDNSKAIICRRCHTNGSARIRHLPHSAGVKHLPPLPFLIVTAAINFPFIGFIET